MSDKPWPPTLEWPDQHLTDGVVALDRLRPSDVPRVVLGCTDPESQRWLPLPDPYGQAEAELFIGTRRDAADRGEELTFAVRGAEDGLLAGALGVAFRGHRKEAEVGYWTAPDRRGRGWTARAIRLAAGYVFDRLPVARIEIVIATENKASRRVAESAGTTYEGIRRNGLPSEEGEDAAVYSLIPQDMERPS